MDKKRAVKLGLVKGKKKKIIPKSVRYFTEEEKRVLIEDYLQSGCSKREIWRKYTGHDLEHGHLLRWMRSLGYTTSGTGKKANFISNKKSGMPKNKSVENTTAEGFEVLQLKKRIATLEASLKDAEMKAIAFSTMVDIAEKEFNIVIKKKYSTKPLKQ
jgi:transposase-like protein